MGEWKQVDDFAYGERIANYIRWPLLGVLLLFNPEKTVRPPSNPAMPVPVHGAQGPGHACFKAAAVDMDAWRGHLEEKGIAIEADFRWPNGARSIYFRDPAGNSIEIAEPRIWGLA